MQGFVVFFTSFALVGVCKSDETNTGDESGAGSGAYSGAGPGGASSGAGSGGAWSGAGPGGAWSGAGPGGATSGAGSWAGSGAGPGGAWAGPGGAWAGPGGAWAGPGGAWAGNGGAWAGPGGAWAGQRFPQHYGPDFSDPNWMQNFQNQWVPSGPGSVQTVVMSGNGYTSCNGLECPQGSSCGSSSVNGATNTICSDNNGNIVAQRVTDRQGNEVDPSKITRVNGFASCATFRCPPNTNCGSSNANGVTTILCADRDGNIVAP